MRTSSDGIDFICQFENFSPVPYMDGRGIWTIGYGTVYLPDGNKISANTDAISIATAQQYMQNSLVPNESYISHNILIQRNDLGQQQFDALMSLIYNVGLTAFVKSQCYECILKGDDDQAINEWNWGMNNPSERGLTARRVLEQQLYLKGVYNKYEGWSDFVNKYPQYSSL